MNKALKNKRVNAYGFQVVFVNGYNVYTCNINIDRINEEERPNIEGVYFSDRTMLVGKYKREKPFTSITFITLDCQDYDRMKMEVGMFLKQHALNKLDKKYSKYEKKAVKKPEYTYEEYSSADAAVQYYITPDLSC